jgi:hypothetical protein
MTQIEKISQIKEQKEPRKTRNDDGWQREPLMREKGKPLMDANQQGCQPAAATPQPASISVY